MCGICGVALADRAASVAPDVIDRMTRSIEHRGPDDVGVYRSGSVVLGHRRLSIVDLGGGHQPMANEDETVWIAYNGEVYNHSEYRQPLEQAGHVFRSRCDTEAIIHLYEERGRQSPDRLRGMFAYAIWDERRRTLLLARDRSGIKPLFYALTAAGDLVFGSEIKAIFASGLIEPELDDALVTEYFAMGSLGGERTLYRGVRKLPPGHTLEWRDGSVRLDRYWNLPDYDASPLARGTRSVMSLSEAADEFWRRFVEAVDVTLMADVPLGVFLSGGVDSSLIVAAMRERGVNELRTFSVGFAEAEASELPFAREVASEFRTDHHEVMCTGAQFFEALPRLTHHRDQPLTFSASIPLYFVSELAAANVKVVLTGEGSDELFAGYGRYPRALLNHRLARVLDGSLPTMLRRGVASAVDRFGDDYVGNRLKRSFLARSGSFEDAYLDSFADFDRAHRAELVGAARAASAYADLGQLVDRELLAANPLEAMLRFDQATYLEELLAKQDQMSMAASIESRVPFLDHRLVEWAATLPPHIKLQGAVGKALVRSAATRVLPRSITHARKRGFLVPLARWLRETGSDVLHEYAPASDDPLMNAAYVRRLIAEHRAGRDHTARLWRILAFQVWRRDVLSGAPVGATALAR
jgi:asparagine synthase (glutamine-hydrolysing)